MFDIIFRSVIAIVSLLITAVLVPFVHSKTTAEQRKAILQLIKDAVAAAEKMFPESGQGENKKAFVLDWLKERGISIDEMELNALIESAVYALKPA